MPRVTVPAALLLAAAGLVLLLPGAAAAQGDILAVYYEGSLGFHFQQIPFPSYSGDFHAEGGALQDSLQFPPGETQACAGAQVVQVDTFTVACYAITRNTNGTYDAAALFIRAGGPLAPGVYPIDVANGTTLIAFLDDLAELSLPPSTDPAEIQAWLLGLAAAHKFLSSSGSISVSEITETAFTGTFSGSMVDVDNLLFLISISNGSFAYSGTPVTAAPSAPAPSALQAQPNPFNPLTVLHYELPGPATITLCILDLQGRCVRRVESGLRAPGPHTAVWDGRNDSALPVASGLYLAVLDWDSGRQITKLVLAR